MEVSAMKVSAMNLLRDKCLLPSSYVDYSST